MIERVGQLDPDDEHLHALMDLERSPEERRAAVMDPSRAEYLSARASEWREYEAKVNTFVMHPDHPRGERWTIIAEGQSAIDAPPDAVLDGPVVLVNRAVAFYEKFGGDVWCVLDHPNAITMVPILEEAMAQGFDPWCWGQWSRRAQWAETPLSPQKACLGVPKRHPDFPLHVKKTKEPLAGHFSVHTAICGAILLGGKEIRTIGVDMHGCGNAVEGFNENPVPKTADKMQRRWRKEQRHMGNLQGVAFEHGIRVAPWIP
jgi:hypothetical protein